ncbi:MAG TPA: hypothetical protein PKC45_18865 [Gemmatales bacterium]|nr:hypothetical protein [Gemmatales bacterium]
MASAWQLQPTTLQMIDDLDKVEWFARVGKPLDDAHIIQIFTWNEAVKYCRQRYSSNVQIESRNLLTERLASQHAARYLHWNRIAPAVHHYVAPLLELKTRDVIKAHKLPKAFVDTVGWDMHAICMELEYSDLIPPKYFAERARWYLAGHFPCGWEGDFPVGGKLVVF